MTDVVCQLPNNATLYRESNGVGGHRYWSDEIGGGVCVWDTCLTDESTLLAAIVEEQRRAREEKLNPTSASLPGFAEFQQDIEKKIREIF